MKPKIIKTQAQYEATLARIEAIFDARPGTAKGDELELLLLVVESYEDKTYPIDLPDPIEALRFRMEQEGLKPKDLIPYIGSKSKVSEVLSGQRPLSLKMIRKLVAGLHLPADVALRETKAPPARRTASRVGNRRLQTSGARSGSGGA
jgi:HTH-type transcriptional regulator/antitoxin HigA